MRAILPQFLFKSVKALSLCLPGLMFLLLSGCAATSQELTQFDLAQMRYEQALRWQDYQGVVSFHKDAYKHASREARKRFQHFKVTEYKVISDIMSPDLRHDTQTVEVHYYNTDYQIVHSMMLHNKWEYDPKHTRWYLLNPMPVFSNN